MSKKRPKLTPVFPPHIKPVYPGPYQVDCHRGAVWWYSFWTGTHWLLTSITPQEAKRQHQVSGDCYSSRFVGWRGLAEEPKEAKQ